MSGKPQSDWDRMTPEERAFDRDYGDQWRVEEESFGARQALSYLGIMALAGGAMALRKGVELARDGVSKILNK